MYFFESKILSAGLGSFPNSQMEEVHCSEHQHCKVECRDKPNCYPNSKCRVEWKIGEGTNTNVEINKRVGVDGKGVDHCIFIFHTANYNVISIKKPLIFLIF